MWNGLLKLTVMVGVVGIGLFAAFQAQSGMHRSSFFSTGSAVAEKSEPSASEEMASAGETPSAATPADVSFDPFAETETAPSARRSQQGIKKVPEPKDDFADSLAEEPAKVQVASHKSSMQMTAGKRTQRKGVDFREDVSEFEETTSESSFGSNSPNEDHLADAALRRSRPTIQTASLQTTEDETTVQPADLTTSPFEEDATESKTTARAVDKTAETSDADDSLSGPPKGNQAAPGRARFTSDPATDSDIPQSKRAKKNAVKRAETAFDTEFDAKNREPKVVQTSSANDPLADDAAPVLGTPALLDEPAESPPPETNNRKQPSVPRSLPSDPMDDMPMQRSSPKKSRAVQPPVDPLDDLPSGTPLRSRDSLNRQPDADRVSPLDMVGDGEIGDSSIRGLQHPRLSIEKVTQQQAILEQPLVYSIIVKNTGSVDARDLVIEDRIPKGTELQGTSPQAELSGKRLIWNHPLLRPNEEKKISIKVIPKQEGSIGSVARVYFAAEVTNEIIVMAPQLEFTVKAPAEVRIGQRFEMVFNLRNTGKVEANNVVVRDLVPESFKHEMGADIECPIGKMAPQDVREIVLPVVATKTGGVVNRAILTADSGIKKTLDSPIEVVGEVLVLTRSGQNKLYVERPVVFTNNIRNEGNQKADRVKIAEVVPAGMEFETASDGGKYDPVQRAVIWTLGPLAPGNDKSVTVKYVPKETGTLAAKVTAVGNAGSSTAINSTIEVVGKPELQMETLSATGTVTVGEQITSRFQLNNTGTAPANNVQLRIKLPRELRLISVKGANFQQRDDYILFEPIGEFGPRKRIAYELTLEPINEADAQIGLEISADHLSKPGRRVETIQIARDALK